MATHHDPPVELLRLLAHGDGLCDSSNADGAQRDAVDKILSLALPDALGLRLLKGQSDGSHATAERTSHSPAPTARLTA